MKKPAVFLLHGLLMPKAIMTLLERELVKAGFATRKIAYLSRRSPWQESVAILRREVEQCAAERIHFVGHSMGGLVVTALLNDYPEIATGRVITIGTPFNGSDVAQKMSRHPFGRWLMGGAQPLLVSGLQPNWTGERPLHLIVGSSGIGLPRVLFGRGLSTPNDGVVSIAECAVSGAVSIDEFSRNHTMLLADRVVMTRVAELLGEDNCQGA